MNTPPFDSEYFEKCRTAYLAAGWSPFTSRMTAMLIQWPNGDTQSEPGPLHKTAKWPDGPAEQPVDYDAPDPESYPAREPNKPDLAK